MLIAAGTPNAIVAAAHPKPQNLFISLIYSRSGRKRAEPRKVYSGAPLNLK
jgi:hypothetical protein